MWDLIVSVPDHCLSFFLLVDTFIFFMPKHANNKNKHSGGVSCSA